MKYIGRLHVLTDQAIQSRFTHAELAELALAGGAGTIQFREKAKETGELIEIADALREICTASGVPLLINDRLDVAMAVDADGVHLGWDDIPIEEARRLLGPDKIIGGTAGSLEEALRVEGKGADYVGFGHIYPTASKEKSTQAKGIRMLERVCASLEIPVIAIGGIHAGNVEPVIHAGAYGVAVISAVCAQEDPKAAACDLSCAIDRALGSMGARD